MLRAIPGKSVTGGEGGGDGGNSLVSGFNVFFFFGGAISINLYFKGVP